MVMYVGDYMFTVDCQCGNVDIIFTENETDSVRRRRVLHRRQLKNNKLHTAVTAKDDSVPAGCSEPADSAHTAASCVSAGCSEPADSGSTAHTAASCVSATVHTCIAGATSTHTAASCVSATVHTCIAGAAAELSWTLSDAVTQSLDTDTVCDDDDDNSADEDNDILSAATIPYTKDAFHKYLIAG